MKKVIHNETLEFTYDSEEERTNHVEEMILQGWETSGKIRRMKKDCSIWDSHDKNNYEWFADFWKYY